jgi:hypothetical protein
MQLLYTTNTQKFSLTDAVSQFGAEFYQPELFNGYIDDLSERLERGGYQTLLYADDDVVIIIAHGEEPHFNN